MPKLNFSPGRNEILWEYAYPVRYHQSVMFCQLDWRLCLGNFALTWLLWVTSLSQFCGNLMMINLVLSEYLWIYTADMQSAINVNVINWRGITHEFPKVCWKSVDHQIEMSSSVSPSGGRVWEVQRSSIKRWVDIWKINTSGPAVTDQTHKKETRSKVFQIMPEISSGFPR